MNSPKGRTGGERRASVRSIRSYGRGLCWSSTPDVRGSIQYTAQSVYPVHGPVSLSGTVGRLNLGWNLLTLWSPYWSDSMNWSSDWGISEMPVRLGHIRNASHAGNFNHCMRACPIWPAAGRTIWKFWIAGAIQSNLSHGYPPTRKLKKKLKKKPFL